MWWRRPQDQTLEEKQSWEFKSSISWATMWIVLWFIITLILIIVGVVINRNPIEVVETKCTTVECAFPPLNCIVPGCGETTNFACLNYVSFAVPDKGVNMTSTPICMGDSECTVDSYNCKAKGQGGSFSAKCYMTYELDPSHCPKCEVGHNFSCWFNADNPSQVYMDEWEPNVATYLFIIAAITGCYMIGFIIQILFIVYKRVRFLRERRYSGWS